MCKVPNPCFEKQPQTCTFTGCLTVRWMNLLIHQLLSSICLCIFQDCHGVPKSQGSAPVRDEIDNYTLMRGLQNDTHTVIEFRRVLDTCDPDDYVLSADTVRVIWALHDNDPQRGAEMVYHGEKRGSQSIHLLGPSPVPKIVSGNPRNWDVTLKNFKVQSNMDTMYWCKVFKAPTLNEKHHIVGFGAHSRGEAFDHGAPHDHARVRIRRELQHAHLGQLRQRGREIVLQRHAPGVGEVPHAACRLGSGIQRKSNASEYFPNHVGLPLGGKKNSYYMLEVHFDNPSMKDARGHFGPAFVLHQRDSGERRGHTHHGVAPSTLHFIPPFQTEYKTAGYCSLGCTKEISAKTPLSFLYNQAPRPNDINCSVPEGWDKCGVRNATFSPGRRKLKLRHIRGGKELAPLAQDDRYDFNYQQSRSLSQDTPILPGDGLITECTYSTVGRRRPTLGGYSTQEEMCLAFILHYPRTQLAGCYSTPPVKYFFETLGIREFYGKDMTEIEQALLEGNYTVNNLRKRRLILRRPRRRSCSRTSRATRRRPEANQRAMLALRNAKEYSIEGENGEGRSVFDKLVIKDPAEFRNLTFTDHLQNIPYNETIFTKKMEEYFYKGLHLTFCRKRDDTLAIKENIEKLPDFQEYENRGNVQCSYKTKMSFSSKSCRFQFRHNFYLIPVRSSVYSPFILC
ncbi:hypothetical protein NQ318_002125 [Aromia moschata]|uniref:DOMON domain-containing protein n=1 Tax=Aromia moschata TaxID=1265417 RepID=A0AAV8XZB9_9CUCU|nr:hypothetical protein NQ318_002125 [Aromia moschata]